MHAPVPPWFVTHAQIFLVMYVGDLCLATSPRNTHAPTRPIFITHAQIFLVMYVGDLYLSDGHRIFRPAAYVAYIVIASAANLVFGLLLAVVRIAILVVTTIFAVGRIDVSGGQQMATGGYEHRSLGRGLACRVR